MQDGYSEKYIQLLQQVKKAKSVLVYVNFLDEYIKIQKGDFIQALQSGHNSGYDMENETGWQWDKTECSLFVN